MGAMQFIPGTHKRGLVPHRQEDAPEHNVLTVVNPPDPATIVPCPLKMGGCTFHHAETWHYTAPNTTDRVRMAWPMEFQIAPTRRKVPEVMPWVDEHRAVVGKAVNATYVGDGKLINI
jgi:ectoine hydroxylase-related dioxygenase (phytanoyl-CoA dioxygenase family)